MMKVMKVTPAKNVVEFVQSEFKTKQFRNDYPISAELKEIQEEVHKDFTRYIADLYFSEGQSLLEEFIDSHHPREEKRKALEYNLYWWKLLYDSCLDTEFSLSESFITENCHKFKDKPLVISWLREWDQAIPKFYYVGYKFNENVFLVIDILEDKIINVIVNNPSVISPTQGSMVMGTLIPYGDKLYSPIIDFYHFDYEAREEMGRNFKGLYEKYLKDCSIQEAFIHVLSCMLQIEHFVFHKNGER